MRNAFEMSFEESQDHLDRGGYFTLEAGNKARYMARKFDDGAYLAYSIQKSSLGMIMQGVLPLGPLSSWKPLGEESVEAMRRGDRAAVARAMVEPPKEAPATDVKAMSPRDFMGWLESGGVFVAPTTGGRETCVLRATPEEQTYVRYFLERQNFEACLSQMANFGPYYYWEQRGPEQEIEA